MVTLYRYVVRLLSRLLDHWLGEWPGRLSGARPVWRRRVSHAACISCAARQQLGTSLRADCAHIHCREYVARCISWCSLLRVVACFSEKSMPAERLSGLPSLKVLASGLNGPGRAPSPGPCFTTCTAGQARSVMEP